uniref:uncharacterized protein LOC132664638 n=1 Tax=Panthera onca TaxID=9690 RepID=UPI00295532A1|nr:uncharacterized protein LOC132664638 [Panthera onca]
MGQSQSTPLSLLVANFRDGRTRGQNLSLDIRWGKLITLCRSEWPTFGVGWPTEGTFCLPIIAKPTWDNCQQLLCILFTTEERERIQLEARNLVPGDDGWPTSNPDLINAAFPLTRPPQDECDYNMAEGRGRLLIYRQTLMAGLRDAARKPTNLAKVYLVIQGKAESPAAYLERLMETFRQFTPMDPEVPENQAAVVMSFVNQAAPDIKKKLQRLEDLEGKQIQDLLRIAQRVYNNRDAPEERQIKATEKMTKVLAAITVQVEQGRNDSALDEDGGNEYEEIDSRALIDEVYAKIEEKKGIKDYS